jgi:hypothetical protein
MVRKVFTVIVFCTLLHAQDYYLTYKSYSKNYVLYNENIYISKAMVKTQSPIFKTLYLLTDYENLEDFIRYDKYLLVDTLLRTHAWVQSNTLTQSYVADVGTKLQIYPVRFKVEINNGLAKIGLYE